jgi:hypothetical protein
MAEVEEHLPSKYKALSSNPNTEKKQKIKNLLRNHSGLLLFTGKELRSQMPAC